MPRRNDENSGDASMGLADLFMICLMVFLILMFVFMVQQGVKVVAAAVDQELVEELMEAQEESLKDAEKRLTEMADQHEQSRKKTREDKQAMLNSKHKAEEDAQTAQQELAKCRKREKELHDQIEELQQTVSNARAAKSLRVDIVHDRTGSMGQVIENTKSTIASMTRTLPTVLTQVAIGLVAYRDGKLATIPIQAVSKASDDGGSSIKRINMMVRKLTAEGGVANTEQAIRASMKRMNAMPGAPRECLVVIGDVGTSEASPKQLAAPGRLLADVKAWCLQSGKNRRVLAIYTGKSEAIDAAFFRQLGSVTPESMFTTNDSMMFELILSAAFGSEE